MMSGTGLTARARSHGCARKDWQNKGEVGSQRGTGRAQRPDSKRRATRPDLSAALCDLLKRLSTPATNVGGYSFYLVLGTAATGCLLRAGFAARNAHRILCAHQS
jgi:hypothetical protein